MVEIDGLLPYKPPLLLLLHIQFRSSSYVASIAKATMKPQLLVRSKLLYYEGFDLLIVTMKNALLHRL